MANRQYNYQSSGGGFNIIPSLIIGLLFLMGLFFLARFVFNILYYLAPVLLIITLVIDHKVVVNYGKWIWSMMGKNPLFGVGLIILTAIGFPVVSLFLFGKAMLKKKIKDVQQQFEQREQGEFVEYEEVDSKPEKGWVELPPPPVRPKQQQRRRNDNEYEDLFEE
jgi:hypothetical protein